MFVQSWCIALCLNKNVFCFFTTFTGVVQVWVGLEEGHATRSMRSVFSSSSHTFFHNSAGDVVWEKSTVTYNEFKANLGCGGSVLNSFHTAFHLKIEKILKCRKKNNLTLQEMLLSVTASLSPKVHHLRWESKTLACEMKWRGFFLFKDRGSESHMITKWLHITMIPAFQSARLPSNRKKVSTL